MTVSYLLSLLLAPLAASVNPSTPATFAVVIANNQPLPGETLSPLRYADDDGARFYELFELMSARVVLHSVLDAESQRLYPDVASVSRPPSRSEMQRSLATLFGEIEASRTSGRKTELYFVFVGHGSASSNGEGTMHFIDGGFTRSDLFQTVIAPSPADLNHVIIDACNAFLFVAGRGKSKNERIDRAVDQFLARETAARHPNTGFLLSTSAAEDVHEWSGFQAGVFSHEVRSALMGGADVDGDGAVTYPEVQAFLQAANGRVTDPRARLDPWVSPPALLQQAPLFDRARVSQPRSSVKVDGQMAGRWSVEDARGIRLADLNIAPDGPVTITLSPKRDHVLRGMKVEIPLPSTLARDLEADKLAAVEPEQSSRGPVADSFRRDLFAIPFGRSFYEGFASHPPPGAGVTTITNEVPDTDTPVERWVGGSFAGAGVVAVATGVIFGVLANDDAAAYRRGVGFPEDLADLRSRAQDRQTLSSILVGTGIAAVAGGIFLLAW